MNNDDPIHIYTDGACRGNPGPGGWGVAIYINDKVKRLFGGEADTTNNRMELRAVIQALQASSQPRNLIVFTDSVHVQKGITAWLPKWQKNGFRNANRKPIKNQDLWLELDEARQRHEVEFRWIKGHSGIKGNELADQLANEGLEKYLS